MGVPQDLVGCVGYILRGPTVTPIVLFHDRSSYMIPEKDLEDYSPTFHTGDKVKVIRAKENAYPVGFVGVIKRFGHTGFGATLTALLDSHVHEVNLQDLMLLEAGQPPPPIVKPGYCSTCTTKKAKFGVVCEECFQRHRDEHRAAFRQG